jgi:hypothetical protein
VISRSPCEKADVFNFEVQQLHNYFVGPSGALVHNESEVKIVRGSQGNAFGFPIDDSERGKVARKVALLEPYGIGKRITVAVGHGSPTKFGGMDNLTAAEAIAEIAPRERPLEIAGCNVANGPLPRLVLELRPDIPQVISSMTRTRIVEGVPIGIEYAGAGKRARFLVERYGASNLVELGFDEDQGKLAVGILNGRNKSTLRQGDVETAPDPLSPWPTGKKFSELVDGIKQQFHQNGSYAIVDLSRIATPQIGRVMMAGIDPSASSQVLPLAGGLQRGIATGLQSFLENVVDTSVGHLGSIGQPTIQARYMAPGETMGAGIWHADNRANFTATVSVFGSGTEVLAPQPPRLSSWTDYHNFQAGEGAQSIVANPGQLVILAGQGAFAVNGPFGKFTPALHRAPLASPARMLFMARWGF